MFSVTKCYDIIYTQISERVDKLLPKRLYVYFFYAYLVNKKQKSRASPQISKGTRLNISRKLGLLFNIKILPAPHTPEPKHWPTHPRGVARHTPFTRAAAHGAAYIFSPGNDLLYLFQLSPQAVCILPGICKLLTQPGQL